MPDERVSHAQKAGVRLDDREIGPPIRNSKRV